MKSIALVRSILIILSVVAASQAQIQPSSPDKLSRPRTVAAATQQPQSPATQVERLPGRTQEAAASQSQLKEQPPDASRSQPSPVTVTNSEQNPAGATGQLPSSFMVSRIGEAERLLKSRPLQTAMIVPSILFVTVAVFDRPSGRIHLLTVPKETFLRKGAEVTLTTSLGTPVNVRVLRANGVNTAVTVADNFGHSLVPLVVEFPIEKGGLFREMAYYSSAHPALLSSDLVQSGRLYIKTMLDLAAKRLREKGAYISPQTVDVAERLCLVEHVDHERFRAESHIALFDEIYSLYALNQLDTYRYSVSTAGAGGMVQMIPWAYNLIRQRHPAVGLTADFVLGMRNHANALQAMLLYMQDTWNDLAANEEVMYAMTTKIASQPELLAAGYNSNAAKLPLYLRRGASGWRTLIPRETQMYLQIYKTVDALVPMKSRSIPVAQGSNTIPGSSSKAAQ